MGAGGGDEVESQAGVSQHSCQAVLEPGLAARVQPQTEAGEVGQGRPLQAVNIEVGGEEQDADTEEDVGQQRRLVESEWRRLEDGEEYFSNSSFCFVEIIAVISENKRKVQGVILWVVDEILLNPLNRGDKTVADVDFHRYLYNLQKAVGTQERRQITSLQYVGQTAC